MIRRLSINLDYQEKEVAALVCTSKHDGIGAIINILDQ